MTMQPTKKLLQASRDKYFANGCKWEQAEDSGDTLNTAELDQTKKTIQIMPPIHAGHTIQDPNQVEQMGLTMRDL